MKVEDKVKELIESVITENNYYLSEVIIDVEDKNKFLRIVIDKDGIIDLDDCVKVTNLINPLLDEANLIDGFYILDVCSKIKEVE